jgi:hypothetical protein
MAIKNTNLLQYGIDYSRKGFYSTGPKRIWPMKKMMLICSISEGCVTFFINTQQNTFFQMEFQ